MATIAPITLGDVALWSHGLHASVVAVGSHVDATPQGHVTPGAIWPYGAIWGHRAFCPYGPYEHVEWALQNVTDTSTADSTTHRAVSWGPYGGPRVVAAPETRIYVAL